MPSYQNNQIGIAALLCFLLWSVPSVAQRTDSDQPLSLIGDPAISDSATAAPETDQQPAKANTDGDKTVANDADQGSVPAAINSLANTSAAYAQVNLGRRKISEVGLAAIGVGDGDAAIRGEARRNDRQEHCREKQPNIRCHTGSPTKRPLTRNRATPHTPLL